MSNIIIKLQSADDSIVEVSRDVIKHSTVIENVYSDMNEHVEESSLTEEHVTIPLPNVSTGQLLKIIGDYLTEYHENVQCKEAEERQELVSNNYFKLYDSEESWSNKYHRPTIDENGELTCADSLDSINPDVLREITLIADYLDIKSLTELTCRQIADLIKGKTVEEIKDFFGAAEQN
jgi:S-phase kinase-associated protein 1